MQTAHSRRTRRREVAVGHGRRGTRAGRARDGPPRVGGRENSRVGSGRTRFGVAELSASEIHAGRNCRVTSFSPEFAAIGRHAGSPGYRTLITPALREVIRRPLRKVPHGPPRDPALRTVLATDRARHALLRAEARRPRASAAAPPDELPTPAERPTLHRFPAERHRIGVRDDAVSAPAPAGPAPRRRPSRSRLAVVRPAEPASPAEAVGDDPVRCAVRPVLAGLRFPARRWQVLAEADAWGASGPIRHLISCLPEGCYRDLDTVVDVLRFLHGRRARPV